MRKCLALVSGMLMLVVTASAAQPKAKKVVDFGQKTLNGVSNPLGRTGVVVKIQSASIAKDGTISVRATIADPDANPLDRLGIATMGPVSLSFIAAYIPLGQTQYTSYTTTVLASTMIVPGRAPCTIPSSPRTTCSDIAVSPTMMKMTSEFSATCRGVPQKRPFPLAARSRAFSAV